MKSTCSGSCAGRHAGAGGLGYLDTSIVAALSYLYLTSMISLLVYCLLQGSAQASPTLPLSRGTDISTTCTNICLENCPNTWPVVNPTPVVNTCAFIDSSSPGFNTRYRSTTEIVWSCLAIIFASTWVCVHPNVTGYETTTWQRLWKRLKLFALAIFAPELLAVFAFFQWKGCRQLHRRFRERAVELGIPLRLDVLKDTQGSQDGPSSGNPVQCGDAEVPLRQPERTKEGVPGLATRLLRYAKKSGLVLRRHLSLFQVDPTQTAWTLTHAHLIQMGGVVFKDPRYACIGFKEPRLIAADQEDPEFSGWTDDNIRRFFALRLSEDAILDKSKASVFAKSVVVLQVLWFVIQTIARTVEGLPITHLEVVCLAFTAFNIGMYVCWWDKLLDVEHPLVVVGVPGRSYGLKYGPGASVGVLTGGLDLLPVGRWIYCGDRKLYPSLYSYHEEVPHSFLETYFSGGQRDSLGPSLTFALSITSASFGAMHLIGWSLPSPTPAEHMVWRVSCLILMLYPLVPLIIRPLSIFLDRNAINTFAMAFNLFSLIVSFLGAIAYIGARFLLLVLPFVELRNLPPLVHQTVSWSNFLPHV